MLFSKSNIYAKEWLDTVFANRNKEYGAYQLRQMSGKASSFALGIVLVSVLVLCGIVYAKQSHTAEVKIPTDSKVTVVEMMDEKELDVKEEPLEMKQASSDEAPQQVAQDVPAQDVLKFTEINATDASKVTEDLVSSNEALDKKKLLGSLTMSGVKGGELVPNGTFGKVKKEGASRGVKSGSLTGSLDVTDPFVSVEIMPEPIGGMKSFVQWVAANYNFPQSAVDANAKGLIVVQFVVETDGSLSAFAVNKDMGYGTGDAAVSLLKKAKKWNPGVQNGRPVRVSFTLPIRLDVTQM